MSARLIGADAQLRAEPPRRRKTSRKIITSDLCGFAGVQSPHHAASSGQHSLPGGELPGATPSSGERPPHRSWHPAPGSRPPAGGKLPKRSSPPTASASPEYSRPTMQPPPASIRSPVLRYPARNCLPMSARLIGADAQLRAEPSRWRKSSQKDHHLRPLRLRRSSATAPRILLRPTFALRS